MRSGRVLYKDYDAGIITETDDGDYVFQYDSEYVKNHPTSFICFSMPVTDMPFISNRLFPFFDGLIPEGWLLDIATRGWKIEQNDRMGLLLSCCRDCIGSVSVLPMEVNDA